jgi:hypothetical protein
MLVNPKSHALVLYRALMAAMAWLLVAATPALAAAVGMVTDLTGKAWIVDGAIRQPLAILAYLEPGTVIEVEKGGSISITFYSPSEEQVFSGGAKFKIEKQGISKISGAAPVVQRLGALAADATNKDMAQGGRRTQAAVRMRSLAVGSPIAGLSPDKTALRSTEPRFSWTALPDIAKYQLTLTTGDGIPVLEESVAGAEWRIPAGKALAHGKEYLWSVEATRADGAKLVGKARFSILTADAAARLESESPKSGASFAQRLRHAITLEAAGLADDARDLWRELAKERPGEPAVQKRAQQ